MHVSNLTWDGERAHDPAVGVDDLSRGPAHHAVDGAAPKVVGGHQQAADEAQGRGRPKNKQGINKPYSVDCQSDSLPVVQLEERRVDVGLLAAVLDPEEPGHGHEQAHHRHRGAVVGVRTGSQEEAEPGM